MIFIRETEMPMCVRGYTSPDKDDNYNIYINKDLNDDVKRKTLEHELNHIKQKHLFCEEVSTYLLESKIQYDE